MAEPRDVGYCISETTADAISMTTGANKSRTGIAADEIKHAVSENLRCALGKVEQIASRNDIYQALALTVRDRLFDRTVDTLLTYGGSDARRVGYLSAEYLPGPQLGNNLLNLGV